MEYSISILKDQNRIPEIINLFKTGLGNTTKEFWQWRLFMDNTQTDKPFAVIAENQNGKIVAMSSILTGIYGKENAYKCLQFCDWVVHPNYRGQGLIGSLYRFVCDYFKDKEYDFIIEFPNPMSYPIFKKYGFIEEKTIPSYNSGKNIFIRKFREKTITHKNTKLLFSEKCPFNDATFSYNNRLNRTADFLVWKFDKNPETKYHWLSLWQDDKCIGYFVFAIHKGRLQTAINIYDWEFFSTDKKLLKFALKKIKSFGNYVSIWGRYPKNLIELLLELGFKQKVDGAKFIHLSLSEKPFPQEIILTRIDTDY